MDNFFFRHCQTFPEIFRIWQGFTRFLQVSFRFLQPQTRLLSSIWLRSLAMCSRPACHFWSSRTRTPKWRYCGERGVCTGGVFSEVWWWKGDVAVEVLYGLELLEVCRCFADLRSKAFWVPVLRRTYFYRLCRWIFASTTSWEFETPFCWTRARLTWSDPHASRFMNHHQTFNRKSWSPWFMLVNLVHLHMLTVEKRRHVPFLMAGQIFTHLNADFQGQGT